MSYAEILAATLDDPTLSAVKELLSVDYEALQSFSRVGTQLTVNVDGLLLKGSQIVIPANLQRQVLELAHEDHQGVNKTKSLLGENVWFPRIDAMVGKLLDEYIACTASYDSKAREPLVMTELPSRKWSHLCADFYGPLQSGEYLLVVLDEYSRFPEVEIVKTVSAQTVIQFFDKVFSSRGRPENLKTGNGTPFRSSEFRNFAKDLGFQHQRITPYWPEANGVAERFLRTNGKVCKCAQVDGKSWKQELYRFLRNYRTTLHTSTSLPPANVLNGVTLKTKLLQVFNTQDDKLLRQNDQSAKNSMKEHAEARTSDGQTLRLERKCCSRM